MPAQIANKFGSGVDKLPLQERYQWAADHVPQIFEAALNPVHGSRWWMQVWCRRITSATLQLWPALCHVVLHKWCVRKTSVGVR